MTIKDALKKANKVVQKKVDDALNNEVAACVKSVESTVIDEVVYGAYTPVRYERRGVYGGLADTENMEHTVKAGVLEVRNETPPNPGGTMDNDLVTTGKYLDLLVEYGHGGPGGFYDFPKRGAAYMKGRPFTKTTAERIAGGEGKKFCITGMRLGLERQGITVE